MGDHWSVFAAPAPLRDALWGHGKVVLAKQRLNLRGVALVLGPQLKPTRADGPDLVAFAFDGVDKGRFKGLLADDDLVAAAFSRRLAAEVWAMTGGSNVDDSVIVCFRDGRPVLSEHLTLGDLGSHGLRLGFDLETWGAWGDFGISGATPSGLRIDLQGDGKPSLERIVEDASQGPPYHPGKADAAVVLVQQAAASGDITDTEAARMLGRLGRSGEALPYAVRAQDTSPQGKRTLATAALINKQVEVAAHLANDKDLEPWQRVRLCEALGRPEEARAVRVTDDLRLRRRFDETVEKALHHPDHATRIRRLEAMDLDPAKHPGWDLLRRVEIARVRHLMGEAVEPAFLGALQAERPAELQALHAELVALGGTDAIEVLQKALEEARARRNDQAFVRTQSDLALALAARGSPKAGPLLERAYLSLGTGSPFRQPLEDALRALGLF